MDKTITTKAILRSARNTIADKAHWCQGNYALNHNGEIGLAESGTACSFCAVGALQHACKGRRGTLKTLIRILGTCARDQYLVNQSSTKPIPHENASLEAYIIYVNDEMGHDATLALYDMALYQGSEKTLR